MTKKQKGHKIFLAVSRFLKNPYLGERGEETTQPLGYFGINLKKFLNPKVFKGKVWGNKERLILFKLFFIACWSKKNYEHLGRKAGCIWGPGCIFIISLFFPNGRSNITNPPFWGAV